MQDRVITYAQNREDVILAAFFPEDEKGFYVDVGAHHPTNDSVTKYFYDRDWHGINIEPNNRLYKLLLQERPNDINLNVGIADKRGQLKYREYLKGDGLSTFSKEMQDAYAQSTSAFTDEYVDHTVQVITLKELFDKQKVKKISFLKIDIEGFEYQALAGNDWDKYRPEVICIEANHIIKDWRPLLMQNRYTLVFNDGLNDYYVAEEKPLSDFKYVDNAISKNAIYFEDHQELLQYKALQKKFVIIKARYADREHDLIREIVHRDAIILESHGFRKSLIIFLHALDNIFLIQVNRLNHPRRKNASKGIEITEDISSLSHDQLLTAVRGNDLKNFYSTHTGSGKYEKQYIFSTVLFMYNSLKKVFKYTAKTILKIFKITLRKEREAND